MYCFSESPGSQSLDEFRSMIAQEVAMKLEKIFLEKVTKLEQEIAVLMELTQQEQMASSDLKNLKRIINQ